MRYLHGSDYRGFTSHSRRAQGRRSSRRQEIDCSSISRRLPLFPPSLRWEDDIGEGGRRGTPLYGADSAFQHGATEWNWKEPLSTLAAPGSSAPVGAEGLSVGHTLGLRRRRRGLLYHFSQSSLAIHLRAPRNNLLPLFSGGLLAFLRSAHACERREQTAMRAGNEARASEPRSLGPVGAGEDFVVVQILPVSQRTHPLLSSTFTKAGRAVAIRRRARLCKRTALHKPPDVSSAISAHRHSKRESRHRHDTRPPILALGVDGDVGCHHNFLHHNAIYAPDVSQALPPRTHAVQSSRIQTSF